jgi:Ca2+-transporting ATPase
MSFASLVIANLGLILTNRSWTRSIVSTLRTPNAALWWVVVGALAFLALTVRVPFLRGLFSFGPLHFWELVLVATAGLISILVSESVKTRVFQNVFIDVSKE